jgi:hypothetical protein
VLSHEVGKLIYSLTDKDLDQLITEEANGDDDVLNLKLLTEIMKRQLALVDSDGMRSGKGVDPGI